MTSSQISQWLLAHDAPFTEEDKNALALLSKTYPYFVPSKYIEAAAYNAKHPFAPAILNKMRLYMGDWISFHEFLREDRSKVETSTFTQQDLDDYRDDEPEYFFDTYEDEQEILKVEEQQLAESIFEEEEEEEDFDLFNEKDSDEEPFTAFDTRKETPKIPEIKIEEVPQEKVEVSQEAQIKTEETLPQPELPKEGITEPTQESITAENKEEKKAESVESEEEKIVEIVKEEEIIANIEDENAAPIVEDVVSTVVEQPDVPIIEEVPQKTEEIRNEQSEITHEEKKSTKLKSEPLIQPIYTEDYFLHQGIEAVEEEPKEEEEKQLMVMMSFSDWLMHFKTRKEKQKEEEEDQKALKTMWQKEKLAAALEEENEEIPEGVFEMAVNSIKNEEDLVSESLAEIMIKQGKFDKAIDMYRKLSLRNPQKNAYFADKIEKLIKEK